jgi:hypothetical protein
MDHLYMVQVNNAGSEEDAFHGAGHQEVDVPRHPRVCPSWEGPLAPFAAALGPSQGDCGGAQLANHVGAPARHHTSRHPGACEKRGDGIIHLIY